MPRLESCSFSSLSLLLTRAETTLHELYTLARQRRASGHSGMCLVVLRAVEALGVETRSRLGMILLRFQEFPRL